MKLGHRKFILGKDTWCLRLAPSFNHVILNQGFSLDKCFNNRSYLSDAEKVSRIRDQR
jgi:hypothetical protein